LVGGERGIRTLDRFNPTHAFQACDFSRSSISPDKFLFLIFYKMQIKIDITIKYLSY
jgi:hypothetical protein